jgi:hypothetical protein
MLVALRAQAADTTPEILHLSISEADACCQYFCLCSTARSQDEFRDPSQPRLHTYMPPRAYTNWSYNPAARRRLLIRDRLGSTHRIMHAHNLLDEMKTEEGNNNEHSHFSMSFAIFPLHIFV